MAQQTGLDKIFGTPAGGTSVLLDVLSGMSSNEAIEKQEKEGQKETLNSDRIAKKGTKNRKLWESLGFVFGKDIDDLFVSVIFPEGWKIDATDHNMWCKLLDDQGRPRGAQFYKAAFYDRDASIHLDSRYHIETWPTDVDNKVTVNIVDKATNQSIRSFQVDKLNPALFSTKDDFERDCYRKRSTLTEQAQTWLDENYPDYKDPLAYW